MKAFVIHSDPRDIWKARSGYRILVIERGAVRFDFPTDWSAGLDGKYVRLVDREPPDDRCGLMVSCRQVSETMSGFPVRHLLREVTAEEGADRPILDRGPVVGFFRPPLEAAWRQMHFLDPIQHRPACTRVCIARGGRTLATIVFDFWPEDEVRLHEMWATFLETLAVGDYIEDAVTGRKREQRG
jgi:hypothetical protein